MGDELVTYETMIDSQGRLQAKAVAFAGEPVQLRAIGRRNDASPLFAASFLLFLCAAVLSGWLSVSVLMLYLAMSFITYWVYAFDKEFAIREQRRTRESTLHLFALCGGWPGAMVAQRALRHKCSKASFLVAFWVTVVLNCMAVAWLTFSTSAEMLRALLRA